MEDLYEGGSPKPGASQNKSKKVLVVILILLVLIVAAVIGLGFGNSSESKPAMKKIQKINHDTCIQVTFTTKDKVGKISNVVDVLKKRLSKYIKDAEVEAKGNDAVVLYIPQGRLTNDEISKMLVDIFNTETPEILDQQNVDLMLSGKKYKCLINSKEIENVITSTLTRNGETKNVLKFTFTEEGTEKFSEMTAANIGKKTYVVCGGKVISNPVIQVQIKDGNCMLDCTAANKHGVKLPMVARTGGFLYKFKEDTSKRMNWNE